MLDLLDDSASLKPSTRYTLHVTAAAHQHGLTTGTQRGLLKKLNQAIDDAIAAQD